jgi:hypothetical protein
MSHHVVNTLEVSKVEIEEGHFGAGDAGIVKRDGKRILEVAPVGESGQRVLAGDCFFLDETGSYPTGLLVYATAKRESPESAQDSQDGESDAAPDKKLPVIQ